MIKKSISVITPVYNTDKLKIQNCIESVKIAKTKCLEIEIEHIIIDDGSSNLETKSFLDTLSKNDYSVTIFFQSHKGQSIARNLGLKKAKYDYILFLDSDDSINYDTFSQFNNNLFYLYDLISFGVKYKEINGNIVDFKIEKLKKYEFIGYTMLCNKLYNKNFLLKNNINFPSNHFPFEDDFFVLSNFIKNPKYLCIKESLYIYNQNKNSVSDKDFVSSFCFRVKQLTAFVYKNINSVKKSPKIFKDLFKTCTYFYKPFIKMSFFINIKISKQIFKLFKVLPFSSFKGFISKTFYFFWFSPYLFRMIYKIIKPLLLRIYKNKFPEIVLDLDKLGLINDYSFKKLISFTYK